MCIRMQTKMNGKQCEKDSLYTIVVVSASFLAQMLQYRIAHTVGVYFPIFLEEFPVSSGAVALISSLNIVFFYGSGPFVSILTNRYGCRPVTIAGGIIGCLGLASSVLARNVYDLYVTFGAVTGFGIGLAYLPSISILDDYCKKWRKLSMGIAASGVGIGQFVYPPLIRYLVHEYGWRGSLLLMGGVTLHLCILGVIFKPLQNSPPKVIKRDHYYDIKAEENVCDEEQDKEINTKNGNRDSETPLDTKTKKKVMLNLFLFKNLTFILLCLSNFGLCFGISVVYIHLAAYSTSKGSDNDKSALLFTAMGISNFTGRLLLGFISQLNYIQNLSLHTVIITTTGIACACVPLYSSYYWLIGFASVYGFLTAVNGSVLIHAIMEVVGDQHLASGYGYLLIFSATGVLLGAPVAGWVHDWTGTYDASFYLAAMITLLFSTLIIPAIVKFSIKSLFWEIISKRPTP